MSDATKKAAPSNKAVRGELPTEPQAGPLYEVTKRSHFIHGREYDPGEKVHFAGEPGQLLKPLNEAAEAAAKKAADARAKRKADAEKKAGK